MVAYMKGPGMW